MVNIYLLYGNSERQSSHTICRDRERDWAKRAKVSEGGEMMLVGGGGGKWWRFKERVKVDEVFIRSNSIWNHDAVWSWWWRWMCVTKTRMTCVPTFCGKSLTYTATHRIEKTVLRQFYTNLGLKKRDSRRPHRKTFPFFLRPAFT